MIAERFLEKVFSSIQEDGVRFWRVFLYLVVIAATFSWKRIIFLPTIVSNLFLTGPIPIVGNKISKLQTFTFLVFISPSPRHTSEIFVMLFSTSPGPFHNTVDMVPPNIRSQQSWRCDATLPMNCNSHLLGVASILQTSGLFPFSEQENLLLRTSYSLQKYGSFAARICWCGHVRKGIGK